MSVKAIDLFCGGGGSSWGAQAAGARLIGAVDKWDLACDVYGDNFPAARVLNKDVGARFSRGLPELFPDVDLVLASPECTNHTCARGSAVRDEDSRRTANLVLRYVRQLKPRWIVIENVVHMRSWVGYVPLVRELQRTYAVREETLDAANFGVPQTRRRLFLICDREAEVRTPLETGAKEPVHVSAILDKAGTWPVTRLFDPRRAKPTLERAERAVDSLGRGEPFLIVYYGTDGAGGWQPIDRPLRTITTLDRFALVEWKRGEPLMRMLQVPELLRAMGFSTEFKLERGTRRDRIKILGNGVCPPVMEAVVWNLAAEKLRGLRLRAA